VLGGKVRQFQAVQHRDGSVALRVIATQELDAELYAKIHDNCRKFFGELPVSVELVDRIPVGENGKRRVVVVER
jgi:hypothetical protein